MLNILTTSDTRARLLTLFVLNPETDYYLKGLVRQLDENNNAVRRELNRLEAVGFVSTRRAANVKYYRLNRSCPIYPEIKGLVLKTSGVAAVLQGALRGLDRVEQAFIYGSVASGTEGRLSDIDVMIVGHVDLSALRSSLRRVEHEVGREINETVYSPEELHERRRAGDAFLQRVFDQPRIILVGDDDERPTRDDPTGLSSSTTVRSSRDR